MADTLDIAILNAGGKKATVFARYGSDIALEILPMGAPLKALAAFRDRINSSLLQSQTRPTRKELTKFGNSLFNYIIRGNIQRLYNRLSVTARISIHILTNDPDLQSLPWEYLQDPNQAPGPWPNRSIVRIIPIIGRTSPLPLALAPGGAKIKILFVHAVPQDQDLVSWPDVKASIERAFAARIPADRYELKVIEGTTEELFKAFDNQQFEIFQFSGHGDVDPQTKVGRILLVNSKLKGQSFPIDAGGLALLLAERGVRLAVLSACQTAAGNSADPFGVVAEALLRAGIPAVVANQLPVPDSSVATFVGPLYAQLLNTGDIDLAVNDGRVKLAIELATAQDATLEWGIPTLYRYIDGSQVFQP